MYQRMCAAAVMALVGLTAGCSDDAQKPAEPKTPPAAARDAGPVVTPPGPAKAEPENLPAEIAGLTAEATEVAVGAAIEVAAVVVDGENDPFHVFWRSTCGAISPDPAQPHRAIFVAPLAPGACQVTVEVKDAAMQSSATRSLDLLVTPPASQEVADVQ